VALIACVIDSCVPTHSSTESFAIVVHGESHVHATTACGGRSAGQNTLRHTGSDSPADIALNVAHQD
jgi:hypothetical protein